jgi:hypothetical protein
MLLFPLYLYLKISLQFFEEKNKPLDHCFCIFLSNPLEHLYFFHQNEERLKNE